MKFEFFTALRYLNPRGRGLFALVTAIIGVAGVAVGVAALVTTLAVMTGFQTDMKEKVIGAQSHILISGNMTRDYYTFQIREIESVPGVLAAAPNIIGQAILNNEVNSMGIILRGLDPELEGKINNLNSSFTKGSYEATSKPGEDFTPPALVLGVELASNMDVEVGDDIVLISPASISSSAVMAPKMKKFRVSGIIKTGYYEFDSGIAYTTLAAAGEFLNLPAGATGISVKLKNIDDAEDIAKHIKPLFDERYTVLTFADMNATLYAALKLEKGMMFIILSLIILVAALNIASNLILLGAEKLKDIGILRAIGARPGNIRKIFLLQGLFISTIGIACGLMLAAALCWLIGSSGFFSLPGDIYYVTNIPVRIETGDIITVIFGSYVLCFLAALYPAVSASRVQPTEAIRYG